MDTRAFPAIRQGADEEAVASSPASLRAPTPVRRLGRAALFGAGIVLTGVGVAAMIRAQLGAGPFDVMVGAMASQIGVSHGTATQATQAAFVVVALLLGRRPGPGTVVSVLTLGPVINLTMPVIPAPGSVAGQGFLAALGLVATGIGVGTFIGARFGPSTGELWSDAVSGHLGIGKQRVRLALETTMTVLGFVFGGPIGLLTVVFIVTIGPLVDVGSRLAATVSGATSRQWERSTLRLSRL